MWALSDRCLLLRRTRRTAAESIDEPSFYERGILQTMVHGERKMAMPTWPVRFDGVPTEIKSAPLLGEHTAAVLADWLGLDATAVATLRQDGII